MLRATEIAIVPTRRRSRVPPRCIGFGSAMRRGSLSVVRRGRIEPTLAGTPASAQGASPYGPCGSLRPMVGDAEALVVEVKPFDVHGVGYVDVTVAYRDRSLETARLGPESLPDDLAVGEQVLVTKAVNMIVAIKRG